MPGNPRYPAAIFDSRLTNVAITRAKSLDVELYKGFETAAGYFSLNAAGTYNISNIYQVSRGAEIVDTLDLARGPLSWKARATVAWDYKGLSTYITGNFAPSYFACAGRPCANKIKSWTTFDAGISYKIPKNAGLLDGTTLSVRAVNVTNSRPPFFNTFNGYDEANADPYGRLLSFDIKKSF